MANRMYRDTPFTGNLKEVYFSGYSTIMIQYKPQCTPLLRVNIQIHCFTPKSLLRWETYEEKARKYRLCGRVNAGHDSRNCPKKPQNQSPLPVTSQSALSSVSAAFESSQSAVPSAISSSQSAVLSAISPSVSGFLGNFILTVSGPLGNFILTVSGSLSDFIPIAHQA